jgi:glycosyltransferase involved in cell wall biosynthesis
MAEAEPQLRIAYVTTGYPYVSHTFILGEVLALRAQGLRIETFALRREPVSECRTPADREAWETTYPLRPPKIADYAGAHARAITSRPRRYLATLARMLRMGAAAPSGVLRHLAYFAQGVVLWDRCSRAGLTHIHAHFGNVASDVALVAAGVGGRELSWSFTMHGPTEFYDVRHHRLADKVRDALFVICISDFARSQLMGVVGPSHWRKLRVVHCGVDVERFSPAGPHANDRPTSITCVARLVPVKGQGLLIDALAQLQRAGHDAVLTLVGDGPERAALQARARERGLGDRVVFRGAVAHTEVAQILRDSDVFCLPSFAEGVPIVLMEAMAMELPVIASRIMGIPELIEDGVSGLLIRPGSEPDLVSALAALISGPDRRRALGRAAREKVSDEFALHSSASRLRELYALYLGQSTAADELPELAWSGGRRR